MATMYCGSKVTAFKGAQVAPSRMAPPTRGVTAARMAKEGIHPAWFSEAKVICNGVEVMTVGGTKSQYNVEVYSGNHPFYNGNRTNMVMDEGQLNKFKKRFADLEDLSTVPVLTAFEDEPKEEKKAAAPQKGKGGKKK